MVCDAPTPPMTPAPAPSSPAPAPSRSIDTYLAPVLRTTRLSPRMLRLTVGGAALRGFSAGALPDERVKLFFPPPGLMVPTLPEFGPDGMRFPPGAPLPHARNYTVRRFDPVLAELDLDFVLHGDGTASNWAREARPGCLLGIAGPVGGHVFDAAADVHLIAGDETALPAVATLVERLPAAARAQVFIEIEDADEIQQLAAEQGAAVDVHWLCRGTGAWATPTSLERAVRSWAWPRGRVQAWVAGEAAMVRSLRRYLRTERGLPRAALHASGYWRLGRTVEEWVREEGDPRAEDEA